MEAKEVIQKLDELAVKYWMISDPDFDNELDAESWALEVESYELMVDYAIEHKVPLGNFDIEAYHNRREADDDDVLEETWIDQFNDYLLFNYDSESPEIDSGFKEIVALHEEMFKSPSDE